jgi:hypothetical protein
MGFDGLLFRPLIHFRAKYGIRHHCLLDTAKLLVALGFGDFWRKCNESL